MVGGKESNDREQEGKVELVCFSFPKVNICYHKLTHSQYAHITPTILCNNTHPPTVCRFSLSSGNQIQLCKFLGVASLVLFPGLVQLSLLAL